ncbi:shikimate kinase [Amniculibacterium aquaticum]|uniref:shikimate kinase n=1 Tax=Amniculibacterium aquaticum TaxID=2479858 RepID=UPI000F598BA6|nr:shikimate kinase [Amniculibacterium aquaticum]
MIISLLGYMGSGKTHISKLLSEKKNFELIDLDKFISTKNKCSIAEIFQNKGELYFRKLERQALEEILASGKDLVLSLGGGTPAYFNNMEIINHNSTSFFLQTSVGQLVERLLKQKEKRPLIANINDLDLPEFVAKHLFERNPYYTKAQFTINTNAKEATAIVDEILSKMD